MNLFQRDVFQANLSLAQITYKRMVKEAETINQESIWDVINGIVNKSANTQFYIVCNVDPYTVQFRLITRRILKGIVDIRTFNCLGNREVYLKKWINFPIEPRKNLTYISYFQVMYHAREFSDYERLFPDKKIEFPFINITNKMAAVVDQKIVDAVVAKIEEKKFGVQLDELKSIVKNAAANRALLPEEKKRMIKLMNKCPGKKFYLIGSSNQCGIHILSEAEIKSNYSTIDSFLSFGEVLTSTKTDHIGIFDILFNENGWSDRLIRVPGWLIRMIDHVEDNGVRIELE